MIHLFISLLSFAPTGILMESYGVSQSSSAWSTKAKDGQQEIAGVHTAKVMRMHLMVGEEPGLHLILWSDDGSFSGASGASKKEGGYFSGSSNLANGRKLEISAKTDDGKQGKVKIGKETFDITKGSLFLISTQGTSPRVKRLTLNENEFPKKVQPDALMEYAKTHQKVMSFWTQQEPGK